MHRKKGGNECALPETSGHPSQDKKQQCRVRQMEQHIHPVMPPGVKTEQLHVGHMREPRQGMPVRLIECREGPDDTLRCQAPRHHRIFTCVMSIVEVEERMPPNLPENKKDQDGYHCDYNCWSDTARNCLRGSAGDMFLARCDFPHAVCRPFPYELRGE